MLGGTTRLVGRLALDPAQPAGGARGHRRGRGRAAALSRERARQRGRRPAGRGVPRATGRRWCGSSRRRPRSPSSTATACRTSTRPRGTPPAAGRSRPRPTTGGRSGRGSRSSGRRSTSSRSRGMGIASGADLNHFVNATRSLASARHAAGPLPAARAGPRACTGAGCSSSTATRWSRACCGARSTAASRSAPSTPAEALVVEDGRVVGARLGGAAPGSVRARRGVVLATGGFPHDRGAHRRDVRARPGRPRPPLGGAGGEHRRRAADGRGGRRHGRRRPRASRAPGRRSRWCRGRTAASRASRTWSSARSPASSPSTRAAGASSTRPTATTTSWRRCSARRPRARSRSPG